MSVHDDSRIRDGALLFLATMESLRICEKTQEIRNRSDIATIASISVHLGRSLDMLGLDHPTESSYLGLLPISLKVCELVAGLDHVRIVMES